MKLLSVIIRTKDRPHLLQEALRSLAVQEYFPLEVIVVNDGGQDVADLVASFTESFAYLKYLRHETSRGRAAAANTGLSAVEGDYFAFLDDDDLLLPSSLKILFEVAESNPSAPLVYGISRAIREEENQTVLVRFYGRPFSRPRLYFENYIPLGSFLVRREAAAGLSFDETLSCLEDWDFLLRIAEKGDFVFENKLVHIYRLQPSSFGAGESALYEKEKNWLKIYSRLEGKFSPETLYKLWEEIKDELLQLEHQTHLWQAHFLRLQQNYNLLLIDFKKKSQEISQLVEKIESLEREVSRLEGELAERELRLALIYDSLGWQILSRYRSFKEKVFPQKSKRRRIYDLFLKGAKVLLLQGPRAFWQKGWRYLATRSLPSSLPRPELPSRKIHPEEIKLPRVENPRVSIIIPVFNQISLTLKTLASLVSHTPPCYEAIVVDDASTDATPELLSRLKHLRYFRQEENRGFLDTANHGASLAKGEFLVFLNNDTLLTPGWLEALLAPFEDNEKVGIVGAKLLYPDGRLQEAGGIIFRDASGWNYGRLEDPSAPEFNFRREVDYCSGACLAIRRGLFEKLGGFDPLFRPAYYEDTDLAFKVRQAGFLVVYQPRAQIFHLEGATCGRELSSGLKRYQLLNKEKFFQKWEKVLKKEHFPSDPSLIFLARQRLSQGIILVADHYVPTWDKDSGSLRLYNLLRMMRELGYHVIFWPDNLAPLQPYTEKLQDLGVEVIYGARDFNSYLQERGRFIDLVWACRVRFAPRYLGPARNLGICTIFDTVDLHFLREHREASLKADPNLLAQAEETKRLELSLCKSADRCVVVSEYEKDLLKAEGIKNVSFLPNIHDPVDKSPPFEEREGLMFIGSFQHPPNEDAVCWFVEEIWPLIKARFPQIKFFIVGSSPTSKVRALAQKDGIFVTGYVPEVDPWFYRARVFVAPLRYGAGLKGKVGQALAFGLPSVLTSIAAEGLGIQNGEEALLADKPEEFAQAVIELYSNKDLWSKLSSKGKLLIAKKFSYQAVKNKLTLLLQELIPEPKWKNFL